MYEWEQQIQIIINEIDKCIKQHNNEKLTLKALSGKFWYSEYYITKKFKEISGMRLRDYLRGRRLAFALKEVRDGDRSILNIAVDYGFSSHEAFTRSFKAAYGITPSEYRKNPVVLCLRTKINTFDRYFLDIGEIGMKSPNEIKTYFVTIPSHKFLYIKNLESNGYWDFWQKQSLIPGQDCETICGLLDSIKGKLDDGGGSEPNSGAGQIMAYISDPEGITCAWGYPRAECYGVRLPIDYNGEIPSQMYLTDIPEAEYIVFEHGPFSYDDANCRVEEEIERAMTEFDYAASGYELDTTPGRIMYFYHDPKKYFKYIRPVKKINPR